MPKKNIEENTDENIEENKEINVENTTIENIVEEIPVEKSEKNDIALNDVEFTIQRISGGGLYVVDTNGNGTDIPIPKKYKNKDLKVGDTIFVSKSEL